MNAPFHLPRRDWEPIVRAVADALRQVREFEVERMQHTIHVLEMLCDGVAQINAEMRAEREQAADDGQ